MHYLAGHSLLGFYAVVHIVAVSWFIRVMILVSNRLILFSTFLQPFTFMELSGLQEPFCERFRQSHLIFYFSCCGLLRWPVTSY